MDYEYWNEYYSKHMRLTAPSQFAKDMLLRLSLNQDKKLIELGCGNGRDATYFADNGINVVAIDQSDSVVKFLNEHIGRRNIRFEVDNFVSTKLLDDTKYDYVYSRFTLHSITETEESVLCKRVYNALNKDGLFLIEARSVKDDIYGLGEKVSRNSYIYNSHFRRFIEIDELVAKLKGDGFTIMYADESDDWAIYKDENPVVVRIIAKKE